MFEPTAMHRAPPDADAAFREQFEWRAARRFALVHATTAHTSFLRSLLAETLAEAVQRMGGNPALIATGPLLDMQFEAQSLGYAAAYPEAQDYIVLDAAGGAPIGRILLDWPATPGAAVVCVDVAVRPSARHGAVGLQLLRAWLATCDQLERAAELHVMPENPARRLYRRLGFVELDGTAFPVPMRRDYGTRQRSRR